jgi:hypothetical protein
MMGMTAVIAVLLGSNALAQNTLVDHLVAACESDLENYCSQVTPGNGRLLHCMAAHDGEVGESCKKAVADTVGE